MTEPRESSIPGVRERPFDTGEHVLAAASQITELQDENRRLKAALAEHRPHATSERQCEHPDVRYFKDEKGAVACVSCGRLFGELHGDDMFIAYNPPSSAHTISRPWAAESKTVYEGNR